MSYQSSDKRSSRFMNSFRNMFTDQIDGDEINQGLRVLYQSFDNYKNAERDIIDIFEKAKQPIRIVWPSRRYEDELIKCLNKKFNFNKDIYKGVEENNRVEISSAGIDILSNTANGFLSDKETLNKVWNTILENFRESGYFIFFESCKPTYDTGKRQIVVHFPTQDLWAFEKINNDENAKKRFGEELKKAHGAPVSFVFVLDEGEKSNKDNNASSSTNAKREISDSNKETRAPQKQGRMDFNTEQIDEYAQAAAAFAEEEMGS